MLLPAARMVFRLKLCRSHRMQEPSAQAVVHSLSSSARQIRCMAPYVWQHMGYVLVAIPFS